MINIDKCRRAANIAECHIVLRLNFLRMMISKFMIYKPIILCKKMYVKMFKINIDRCTDFLVKIIEMLHFLLYNKLH